MTPETIPHLPLPAEVIAAARSLLASCSVHTSYGGTGWLMTSDETVRDALLAGWVVLDEDEPDGERVVKCGWGQVIGSWRTAHDSETAWYELSLPPALVPLAREMRTELLAAA